MVCDGRDVVTVGLCYCDGAVAVPGALGSPVVPRRNTKPRACAALHIAFINAETINKHRATHLITVSAFTSRLKLC